MFRVKYIAIILIVFCYDSFFGISEAFSNHPSLILSEKNLNDFKEVSISSKKALFEQVMDLANNFCERQIPAFKDANNKYREIGDGIASLGLVYQLTGDNKYVVYAEKWITAMLNCREWNGSQNLGRSAWTMGLTFLYDWLYDVLDDDLKKKLIVRLITEVEIIIEDASYTRALSNHLLIETSAIGIVGLALEDSNSKKEKFLNQADQWANYIINHAPTDGSWGEGVQYWQYGTGYFLRFLEAAQTCGFKDYFENYQWLKRTCYFPIYFSMPGNLTRVINFSDCGTDRYLPAFLFYLPASKYQNGYFQDFGKQIQSGTFHKFSWLDFLFYDDTIVPMDFTTLLLFSHFDDHGFVSMRSGWNENETVVGFRCGPAPGHRNQNHPDRIKYAGFGPGHQQPDINNFCVYSRGEWLIIDPGYTRKKETKNHNTILVNGYGQAGAGGKWLDYMAFEARKPAPEIIYSQTTSAYDYVIGDAGDIYVDEAKVELFRRHILFLKPDVIILLDEVKLKEKAEIKNLFQLNEIAKAEKIGDNYKVKKNEVEFWVLTVMPESIISSVTERLVEGSDVHGLPDHREGILKTIQFEALSRNTDFLTVISINNKGTQTPPILTLENNTMTIEQNGKLRKISILSGKNNGDPPRLKLIE